MVSLPLQLPNLSFISNNPKLKCFGSSTPKHTSFHFKPISASFETPPFRLFEPSHSEESASEVIMEIPLELMLTISQKLPWMFFPDIVPVGHPIFDIINSTDPELYGDFLPSADECTSLLLASEEELSELQDQNLALTMKEQQYRALDFWERNWHSSVPLKIKRLARDPERFIWALSIAQSRCISLQMRIGALVQDANMLIPYANRLSKAGDDFVDGAVLAAARTLPT
ncbi:hypothetical protein IFM89_002734 [Coptis chinensis]|uniref:Uncharacterized protein n=1 Tax=Coptis chinensis TaxID=261450 RepID=A0A835MCM7_9MAGN|nr:hypothetical protein IFM89_002734 [Coptis chinensis]